MSVPPAPDGRRRSIDPTGEEWKAKWCISEEFARTLTCRGTKVPEIHGWKAIAAHLGVSVRTAQRYETALGLPVVRTSRPGGVDDVRATRDVLDRWLADTAIRRASEQPDGASIPARRAADVTAVHGADQHRSASPADQSTPRSRDYTRIAAIGLAAVLLGVLGSLAAGRLSSPALPLARPIVGSQSPSSNIVGDTRGQLVGRIAIDLNGNGEWDAGEAFIAEPGRDCPNTTHASGFVVRWTGEHQGSSAPMNCNPEPFYHGRLRAGRYTATLEVPLGWRVTSPAAAQVDVEPGKDTHLWFAVVPTEAAPTDQPR